MRRKIFALSLAVLMLSACGAKKDMPEDTPYNHYIMETENGYYSDHLGWNGSTLSMRFYERDTGNQVYLCARPECLHDGGDSCTATFKDLQCFGSVLYDEAIYIYAAERSDSFALSIYKAALDGSSLTKISDVFSMNNVSEEEVDCNTGGFMIHNGQAYASYHITLGDNNYTGFIESGLAKVDISSGKKEILWNGDDPFAEIPRDICGSGEYVYYSVYSMNKDAGFYRYGIKTSEIEKVMKEKLVTVGERKFFLRGSDGNGKMAVLSCGKEKSDIEKAETDGFDLVAGGFEYIKQLFSYKDMVIVVHDNKIAVCSEEGGALGEIAYDEANWYDEEVRGFNFTVSAGKIYVYFDPMVYEDMAEIDIDAYTEVVYSYPLEDIVSGNGEWKFEYGIKSIDNVNIEEKKNIFSKIRADE